MSNKTIALLRKLKALADRGVGGEKDNAERMLFKIMNENGITMDQIEGEEKNKYWFRTLVRNHQFLYQIVCSVVGPGPKIWIRAGKPRFQGYELTVSEYIEVEARFGFFLPIYEEEQKMFYKAFIYKNELTTRVSGEIKYKEGPLTAEERRILELMGGIKKHQFNKQINADNRKLESKS